MTQKPESVIPEGKEADYPALNFVMQLNEAFSDSLKLPNMSSNKGNTFLLNKNLLSGLEHRIGY